MQFNVYAVQMREGRAVILPVTATRTHDLALLRAHASLEEPGVIYAIIEEPAAEKIQFMVPKSTRQAALA